MMYQIMTPECLAVFVVPRQENPTIVEVDMVK